MNNPLGFGIDPGEVLGGGEVKAAERVVTIDDLKRTIPAHCFNRSYSKSLFYLFRDFLAVTVFGSIAWYFIPPIQYTPLRYVAWIGYGYVQGLVFTGLWVQAHECGHGAFSPSQLLNDTLGLFTHSFLLVPYFGWKSTHRRHHTYVNNLDKDPNFIPPRLEQIAAEYGIDPKRFEDFEEVVDDVPLYTLLRLMVHQGLGLIIYFTTNLTASDGSLVRPKSKWPLGNSHILPTSTIFRPGEAHLILISDIGIAVMTFLLYQASLAYGFGVIALLYGQAYMWANHWVVAITYLHHTHTELPKYGEENWSFVKGALATIDRDRGWVGKHFFHNISDYHVIHHLFSRIPHYHTEEATKAIMPLLGDQYRSTDQGFISSLWESFSKCRWVKPTEDETRGRVYKYKAGRPRI